MVPIKRGWQWLALLALSLPLTAVLEWLTVPAALLLGPMIAAIAFGVGGIQLRLPRGTFTGAQGILGCLIARALTPAILVSIAQDWMTMLLVVATTVIAGGIVGWVMFKVGTLPGTTAAWGSSPGAASAMIALAEEFGADVQLVAFMQYLRIVIVVLTASFVSRLLLGTTPAQAAMPPLATLFAVAPWPFAATLAIIVVGALIGRLLRIPGGGLLIPMVAGTVLHSAGVVDITLPPFLLGVAYAALGWYVGLGFTRRVFLHAVRAIPQLLLATLLLMALCALSAWLLTLLLHTDALTAYLATSPGGLDAIAIIAIASHADLSFVMATQTLRLFVVILTGPQIARLICRYA